MSSTSDTSAGMPRLDLRKRLLLTVLLVGIVPLLVATALAYHKGRENLEASAFATLIAVRDGRAQHIQDTYEFIEAQVLDLTDNGAVTEGLEEFGPAMRVLPEELGWTAEQAGTAKAELRGHYAGPFAERFQGETGRAPEVGVLVPREDFAVAAQLTYVGGDGGMPRAGRAGATGTTYGKKHDAYHPLIRSFQARFGYYDVFLVDPEGYVVYSVTKEIDFATNLRTGPYRKTGLAEAALNALEAVGPGEVLLTDYDAYLPSYDEPNAFISAPVFVDGISVGALVFQMPIRRINDVMTSSAGLGETGETYLVARDGNMRSDSRFQEDTSICTKNVDTAAIQAAFRGETGSGLIEDYRGEEVLSTWMPLDVLGLEWALVAEIDAKEAFAPADLLLRWMIGLVVVLGIAAIGVAFIVTNSLARPVGEITERLEGLAQSLLTDSQEEQAGAAEQSAAVEETRQTFGGLLEASASVNRIGTDVLGHAEVSQRSAQTIGARIQDLSTSAETITEILALVKDIANKSEILALNAALEGTKAGEAGRGFSLVAQQMQRLAEQVMESVKTIESQTGQITEASHGAVLAAEEAEKVSRLTTEAAREIAGAVELQQASAEQISVAMNEVSQVAGRNVESARQVVASSNDLLDLAARLRATVGVKG